MKTKTIVLITILITTIVIVGGLFLYGYELNRNQEFYNQGYTVGLLYTQDTGNIVIIQEGNLTEITIGQVCSNLMQQVNN